MSKEFICTCCGDKFLAIYSKTLLCKKCLKRKLTKELYEKKIGGAENRKRRESFIGKSESCKFCEKKFIIESNNQLYCSLDCKKTSLNERKRSFYRENIKREVEFSKDCVFCKKNFITKRKQQKYCSELCQNQNFGSHRNIEKSCIICSKLFISKGSHSKKKTCSEECSVINKINREKRDKVRYEKSCLYCSATFNSGSKKQVFCSRECAAVSGLKDCPNPKKPTYNNIRICSICNAEFPLRSIVQKTCSKKCSSKAHNEARAKRIKLGKQRKSLNTPDTCLICNSSFLRTSSSQKTCSKKCSFQNKINKKEVRKSILLKEKKLFKVAKCSFCKKDFCKKIKGRSIFCSEDCRKKSSFLNYYRNKDKYLRRRKILKEMRENPSS